VIVGKAESPGKVVVEPEFLSMMAHELSQPLTAARGSAHILRNRFEELEEATRLQLTDTVIRNLEQLQALLDSLRIFSEAESGSIEVERTRVSVDDLFREAEENFGTPSSSTKISFNGATGLFVNVEVRLFRQVLSNIIANADKFSPSKSLISVDAHEGKGGVVVFTISDEGSGFPPEEAERIFAKSVRLQPGKAGLGLGLFVAMAIVLAHGGRIWAENIDGGARFSVEVDAA
jgi:K+-sensing histidine kinase KdpD